MEWAEAYAYAESVIDSKCAEQGITREITDPSMLAAGIALLRIGKRNVDARLVEESATRRRVDRDRPDVRPDKRPALLHG